MIEGGLSTVFKQNVDKIAEVVAGFRTLKISADLVRRRISTVDDSVELQTIMDDSDFIISELNYLLDALEG